MYKLELTEKEATYLLDMWVGHAEWADPLQEEDRTLYALIEKASQTMPAVYEFIKRQRQEEREAEAAERRKAAEKAGE